MLDSVSRKKRKSAIRKVHVSQVGVIEASAHRTAPVAQDERLSKIDVNFSNTLSAGTFFGAVADLSVHLPIEQAPLGPSEEGPDDRGYIAAQTMNLKGDISLAALETPVAKVLGGLPRCS